MTDQELEELRQRWEADPGSRVFLQLAEEYRRTGRTDEAIGVLEQGLERSPNHLSAKVALGRCRLEKEEFEAAGGIFEEVLERDPTQLVANKLLVEAYLGLGEPAKAARRLDLYRLLNDGDPVIEQLQGRLDAATAGLEAARVEASDEGLLDAAEEGPFSELPEDSSTAGPPDPFGGLADPAEEEPFPELQRHLSRHRYLESLQAEGLFVPLQGEQEAPETPIVARPAASREDRASETDEGQLFDFPPVKALPRPEADSFSYLIDADSTPEEDTGPPVEEPPPSVEAADPPEVGSEAGVEKEQAEDLATVTLGHLYLNQGHREMAREVFQKVLEREPKNVAARFGLASAQEEQEEVTSPKSVERSGALTAQELLAGVPPSEGLSGRKAYVLQNYLRRIRREA